ncbi:MAG: peptidase domain-containing ABC transporter, partial [Cyclobacteriaceae bacterium]
MNYKRRFQKYFVKQHDEADCGVACLASIIKYYEGTPSIEQLRIDSGTSREGTTILGLLHAARANGFDADGMEADNMNELRGLTGPAIVHVLINEMGHYMVFYAIAENKALLSDPDRGLIWYELADFDKVWKDKVLLTLAPNSSFVKTVKQRNEKIQWIKRLLAEDMPTLVSSLTLGICITALSLTTAIFSQKLIDQFLPEKDQVRVNLSLVIVSILLLIRIGLSNFRGNLMAYQSMTFNNRIIKFFYEKLLDLPKSFFDSRKTGDILARINDTNRIQTTVSSIAGTFVVDILIV